MRPPASAPRRRSQRQRRQFRAPGSTADGRSALIPPAEIIFVVRSVARGPTQDKPAALPPRRIWSKTPSRGAGARFGFFFFFPSSPPPPRGGGGGGGGGSAYELKLLQNRFENAVNI